MSRTRHQASLPERILGTGEDAHDRRVPREARTGAPRGRVVPDRGVRSASTSPRLLAPVFLLAVLGQKLCLQQFDDFRTGKLSTDEIFSHRSENLAHASVSL